MPKKQFSIRLEMDLYEQLENYRWCNRKSLNVVITEAVDRYLSEANKTVENEIPKIE